MLRRLSSVYSRLLFTEKPKRISSTNTKYLRTAMALPSQFPYIQFPYCSTICHHGRLSCNTETEHSAWPYASSMFTLAQIDAAKQRHFMFTEQCFAHCSDEAKKYEAKSYIFLQSKIVQLK